jgi:hypothetical protein
VALPVAKGGGDEDRKKKRRGEPEGASEADRYPSTPPSPNPPPAPPPAPVATHERFHYKAPKPPRPVSDRILALNKNSGRVIPTEVTYALGSSNLTDKDLDKASRFFGQQFDLAPEDFFDPVYATRSLLPSGKELPAVGGVVGYSLGGIPDPVTGEPYISLRTARRLLEANEESIIHKWLEGRKGTPTRVDAKGNVVRGTPNVSSKSIIRNLNELTPLVGEDLNFGEAMAIATNVAEMKVGREFKANLEVAIRTSFGRDPKKAVTLAAEAASKGFAFRDVVDMAAFLGGATREEVAAGVALQDTKNVKELQVNGRVVQAGVGDFQVLGGIFDALNQREQSYSEAANTILEEMRVEQSDDRSLAELWLGGTMKALQIANRPMDAVFRVVADTDALLAPFEETGAWTEITEDGRRIRHTEGTTRGSEAVGDAWDILTGEQNVLDNERLKDLGWSDPEILIGELYLSILIPVGGGVKAVGTAAGKVAGKNVATRLVKSALTTREGFTATLRLGGELAIDPFTGFGKLGKVSTGRKFLPFMDPAAQGRAVRSMLYGKRRALGGKTIGEYLVDAASKEVDPEAMFGKAVSRFRAEFSRDGLHPMLNRAIFSMVQKGKATGLTREQMVRAVNEYMAQALGVPITKGGLGAELAAEVERLHMAGRRRAVAEATAATRPSAMAQEIAGRDAARKAAQQIADQVDRVARDIDITGPIMHEIPKIKSIRTLGLTGAKFDTKAARAYRAVKINELPVRQGSRFVLTPDLDPADAADALDTVLVRSRVFSLQEMQEWRQRLTSAMRPGFAAREAATLDVVQEAEKTMLKRLGKELGVPPDTLEEWVVSTFGQPRYMRRITDAAKRKLGYDPDNAFGIIDAGPIAGKVPARTPLRPAQLQNAYGIIDPVYVRKAAKETMGYARELNEMAVRLGIGSKALSGTKALTKTPSRVVGVVSRELIRPALGLVKFGWVARPAYVLRIVLGDEMLRYAATEGLGARFMGSRLAARMLKNRNLPSTADIVLRTGLSEEDAIALKLTHLLADEPQAGQGAIRSLANAEGDILPADVQRTMVSRWAAIVRGEVDDKAFNNAWERALFQYGQDNTGRRMLQNAFDGMDAEDSITDIQRWWKNTPEGRADFARMKANVKEFNADEASRVSVEYLDTLLPDKSYAGRVLDGTLQPEDLGRLDGGPMVIHGPAMHPQNSANVAVRAQRFWGKWILEMPTNQLIRQPFFKANYSTVYQSLRERALLAGADLDAPAFTYTGREGDSLAEALIAHRMGYETASGKSFKIVDDAPIARSILHDAVARSDPAGIPLYRGRRVPRRSFTGLPAGSAPREAVVPKIGDEITFDLVSATSKRGVAESSFAGSSGSSHMAIVYEFPPSTRALDTNAALAAAGREVPEYAGEGEQLIAGKFLVQSVEEVEGRLLVKLENAGTIDVIPPSLDAAMQTEAKRFAIARTQQIMFDFTRTGRISELLWFISPFFQPFTEFFLAWPKIIRQNPAMVPYAYRLGKAAMESGFFKDDPQTGEKVVPMSNWMGAAPLLALTTSSKLADSPGGGWELFAPLTAFNMFATNAYQYRFDGTTIPIPTPSFSPPVQWFLQWSLDKFAPEGPLKEEWMAYLTEFGEIDFTRPQDFLLPSWIKHAMMGAVPSWFDDYTNQNVAKFMALHQAMHPGEPFPAPGTPEYEALEKQARGQAQAFGGMRAFISATFPASPRVSFPTDDLEDEWQEVYEKHGGDPQAALAEFAGTFNVETGEFEGGLHPGMYLIAASKTMWEDESNPFPMPANKLAERILNSKGGKEFAQQYPEFAFFIIPKEIRESDFDLGAFYRQMSEGRRVVRTPSQFVESADVQNGWNAYFAMKAQFDAWKAKYPEFAKGTPSYDHEQEVFNERVADLREFFPAWSRAYNEFELSRGIDPTVKKHAMILAQNEEFTTKTDGGAGLKMYWEARDELERDMAEANVDGLDSKLAERLGFVQRYEELTAAAKEAHPDFALMYDYLGFENDLGYEIVTKGQKERDAIPNEVWDEVITPWEEKFLRLKDKPYDPGLMDDPQRFAAYKKVRDWANTAYDRADGTNPLKLWWAERNDEEKADYRAGLGSRSAIYWSRFDWDVMGIKQTGKQQEFWVEIDRLRSEAFAGDNVGADLERIDAAVKKAAAKNKGIARQLEIINTWHFGLEQAVFGKDGGEVLFPTKNTKGDWKDVFEGSQTIHDYMNKYEMTGEDDYDPDLANWYDEIKKTYIDYIVKKRKDNPVFDQQWKYLQELVGSDFLIDTLMPTSNYDLGVAKKGTIPAIIKERAGRQPLMNGNAGSAQDFPLRNKKSLGTRNGVTMVRPALNDLSRASRDLGLEKTLFKHVSGTGFRTHDEQAAAYQRFLAGEGARAAPPGSSMHEVGRAIDVDSNYLAQHPELVEWLDRAGWVNAVPEEPWHWEYQG